MDKQWYSVKLVYKFDIAGEPTHTDEQYQNKQNFFEESIILVNATSFDDAYEKAEKYGRENEETYQNEYDQTVLYVFVDTLDCYVLGKTIESETQVYASIRQTDKETDADQFIENTLKNELDINSNRILTAEKK